MIRVLIYISLLLISVSFDVKAQGQKLGKVTDYHLDEISGITAYSNHSGYFWVHNDSGDEAQIYLIDSLANLISVVCLEGVKMNDCEDIARIYVEDVPYLILADIGNNLKRREYLSLYMFPEPKLESLKGKSSISNEEIRVLQFKYSDKRRDAEAIFVDQQNQEIYIVSKRDFRSTVFSFPVSDFFKGDNLILAPKATLPFTFVTAADMSLNGEYILVKNIANVYMWRREKGDSVLETLSKPFVLIPYEIEPQGEAICFDSDKRYFYTISERPLGLDSYLYRYIY